MAEQRTSSSGGRFVGDWCLSHRIGSGSFAVVWKAVHKSTGEPAAVKEIWTEKLNQKLQESLESEMSILGRTKHANIVSLYEIIKEPASSRIYLVTEFCAGGDLNGLLRRVRTLPEHTVRGFMQQLAAGLKELRALNLIHRDLKPQNLLLSKPGADASIKIADFGFARDLQPQGLAETLCGSPLYMAPEILQSHKYDAKADLWSVGAIMFEMVAGHTPFNGRNHVELLGNIQRHEPRLPVAAAARLSTSCKQLLGLLLKRNPVERIGFDEFFSHPFLTAEGPCAAPEGLPVSSAPKRFDPAGSELCPARAGQAAGPQRLVSEPRCEDPVGVTAPLARQPSVPRAIPSEAAQPAEWANRQPCGPTPAPTPSATHIFSPSSLPRLQVAALWGAFAGGNTRAKQAANAADQVCEQFSEQPVGRRLVEVERSGSSSSLAESFERDYVMIATIKEEEPGNGSSLMADSAQANATIANAFAAQRAVSGGEPTRSRRGAGLSSRRGCRPSCLRCPPRLSCMGTPPRPAGRRRTSPRGPSRGPRASRSRRSSSWTGRPRGSLADRQHAEALVLSCLSLQTLAAALSLRGPERGCPEAGSLTAAMNSALTSAQEAANSLMEDSGLPPSGLPCPMELAYRLALEYGRSGAVDELMGNYAESAHSYGAASTLLTFIIAEVPRLPASGVLPAGSPARRLAASDEQRLRRYLRKLGARSRACQARTGAEPGGGGGGGSAFGEAPGKPRGQAPASGAGSRRSSVEHCLGCA
uniref:Unc51-like kinase n=1 Tax=Tetraselmis sp. GSL018 TaxID=582737 RepID=A0A061RD52_9CHLO